MMQCKLLNIDLIRKSITDVILLLCGTAAILLSLRTAINLDEWHWFGRAGSIMVLFSIIVEFRNMKLQQTLNDKAVNLSGGISGILSPSNQPRYRQILIGVTHIFVVVGTFIWGYGDCFGGVCQ